MIAQQQRNLKDMNFLVYGLMDPQTQEMRYVGKSCSGLNRPKCHWNASGLKERTKKAAWVKNVLKRGLVPEVWVLEYAPNAQILGELECSWIEYFKANNINLTNMTNGGDGCPGRIHSDETKNRISLSNKGKVISEQTKVKISLARGITPEKEAQVLELLKTNLGAVLISRRVGVSKRTVYLIAKKHHFWRNPNWRSALATDNASEAFDLRQAGWLLKDIAAKFNVSQGCASRWCKLQTTRSN